MGFHGQTNSFDWSCLTLSRSSESGASNEAVCTLSSSGQRPSIVAHRGPRGKCLISLQLGLLFEHMVFFYLASNLTFHWKNICWTWASLCQLCCDKERQQMIEKHGPHKRREPFLLKNHYNYHLLCSIDKTYSKWGIKCIPYLLLLTSSLWDRETS